MSEFVCQNCGNSSICDHHGREISNVKSLDLNGKYVCGQCGAEVPQEQISAMIAVGTQKSNLLSALYLQGREAKKNGNFAAAFNIYQQILTIDPDSWEAAFSTVYCNSRQGIGAIDTACEAMTASLKEVLDKLDKDFSVKTAITLLVSDILDFSYAMFDAAVKAHTDLGPNEMNRHNNALKEQLICVINVTVNCAALIMERYGDNEEIASNVVPLAKASLGFQTRQNYVSVPLPDKTSKTFLEWIGMFEPEYVAQYKKKQLRSMVSGIVLLLVLGAVFLFFGLNTEGTFGKWFCIPMAVYCLFAGFIRFLATLFKK